MNMTTEKYITSKIAREYFCVSEMTFRRWLQAGAPHLKISNHVRVKISEIENWLKGKNEKLQPTNFE